MDTNRIKSFATEARNILKAGIAAKITTLGFDKNGHVAEENKPLLMQGGSVWNGQLQTEGFYHQWVALYNRIQQIGIKDVYEEAAYTWFNRLCAIRILQKNNLCTPVLAYADAARTPVIVDEARQGRIPLMKEEMRQRLAELLDDDTKVTEQFAILITAWCHDNPIINKCFGGIADYTELLLPNNILAKGGFVDQVNNTEFITDDDFKSPELIGWLYQFYISERKDEVFAKKGKFEADEIPAATQIFTPNWIVKYMVQNTVGRIYLDNNPYETQLQKKWKYLVPIYNSESQEPSAQPIINSKLYTINYPNVEQKNFEKIPGAPIGYWVSPKIQEIFTSNLALSAVCSPTQGLATADNARFLRSWFEVNYNRIGFGYENAALAARSQKKWFSYNKGGAFRRWYGFSSNENIINWSNDGQELKNFPPAVIRNPNNYFKEGITFPRIGSNLFYARFSPKGSVFDCNGPSCFPSRDSNYILALLNSKIMQKLLFVLCPTLSFQIGDSFKVPYIHINNKGISTLVNNNIAISQQDWDAHETSWDFQRNELLSIDANTYTENINYEIEKHFEETGEHICIDPAAPQLGSLEWRMEQYKTKWERKFMQLHKNEEELNRQFIDIYGLQDELTPDVPLNEITILQQGEISINL